VKVNDPVHQAAPAPSSRPARLPAQATLADRWAAFRVPLSPRLKYRREFIRRATGRGPDTRDFRRFLAGRFARIHGAVKCAHQEGEMLAVAEAILASEISGPIIELGCFKGGSSAKLSLVAQATGRTLYVCDSYQGLPEPDARDREHAMVSGKRKTYAAGEYRGTRDEVEGNVAAWGAPAACRFVEGFFSDSLPALDVRPAMAFMDVDLISSARDCLRHLWPRMLNGARYYTHEAGVATFLEGILDGRWWHETLGACAPPLIGAGYGHGPEAKHLAYFTKPS
jgi:O-methyltransferase